MADVWFCPRDSFLAAAALKFADVGVGWAWFFPFTGGARCGWPLLAKAIGFWQHDPIKRINEEYSYAWPSTTRIKRAPRGFTVRLRHPWAPTVESVELGAL
ncbi:hypothetical protein OG216_29910 [Streptomycetaceae bacterium NBC_01309]